MSCTAEGKGPYARLHSSVACPVDCTLRPGESGRHEVRIFNYGPLATDFNARAECESPLVYATGGRVWDVTIDVPPAPPPRVWRRLDAQHQPTWNEIELPIHTELGRMGRDASIAVVISRTLGDGGRERVGSLTLSLQLRS